MTMKKLLSAAALWLALCAPVAASQATWVTPGAPLPMTSLATFLNNGFAAVGTFNSGTTSPTVGPAGAPIAGMAWFDTSATPWKLKYYDGAQWVGGPTVDATNHLFGAAFTNTVNITPTSGSTIQALTATSSLPGSCSSNCGGPFNFSSVSATNAGYQLTGTTLDSFGLLLGNLAGFRVNLTNSGTNGTTVPNAFIASARAGGASNPNLVGATLSAYSNINSSGDALWGGLSFSNAGPAAVILQNLSFDCESANATGAVVKYRYGCVASSIGPVQASGAGSIDAAFVIRNAGTFTTDPNYATAISWHNGLAFVSAGGNAPLDTTGNAIFSDGTFTTGSFVNMPNVTFTGDLFNLANFHVTGAGVGTITGPSGSTIWTVTTSGGGIVQMSAAVNGASGLDALQIFDSSSTDRLFLGQFEAGNTGTRFGQTRGGWSGVFQFNGGSGLMLGTVNSAPVIVGTNDTARMTFAAGGGATLAGNLTFSPTTDGVVGTTTNDGASAGVVGEYVVSGVSSFNNTITGNSATVTITIASPGVVTWTSNPFFLSSATGNGCASAIVFSTTGALPTGLVAGTVYYVTCDGSFTANAFHVSTSVANAIAGTAINTSGTQSGTQTGSDQISLSNGSALDFGGLSLTAGDWDVTGVVHFAPAATTSVTVSVAGTSSASNLSGTFYSIIRQAQAAEVPTTSYNLGMSTERISLSSPATIFCGTLSSFTLSTMAITGLCRARRVR